MKPTPLDELVGRTMGSPARPLSRAAIDTWQGAQLGRLIGYCRERSAFYRRKLAESTAAFTRAARTTE